MKPFRGSIALLALFLATSAGAIQYPVRYTFRCLGGNDASGLFIDDDVSNPLYNFDRMGFRAYTGTEFGVDGYFLRVVDFMATPPFTVSPDGAMLSVNGGIPGFDHGAPNPGFISMTTDVTTWIATWTWNMLYQDITYTASGTGLWLREDLSTPITLTSGTGTSVPDAGVGTMGLLALGWVAIDALRRRRCS